jgi:hypothetical protein
MKHLTEEDLVLLYYAEPNAPPEGRSHLAECTACRAAAQSLAATFQSLDKWTAPDPGSEFERSVWARLAPQLAPQTESRPVSWSLPVRWLVPALCALLLGAFLVGRLSKGPESPVTAALSDQARERILAITLADHLDRAETLLTEISNASDTGTSNFTPERQRAQDLVDEGRLIIQTIARGGSGQSASSTLLDEVERFMLEVANSPDEVSAVEVRSLQRRMNAESLLFKVRIIESNLRTKVQKS